MAKAMAVRGSSEPNRVSVAIVAATRLSAGGRERRDLLAVAVLAALEAALNALPVPALIVSERGEIVCANAAARARLGRASSLVPWMEPFASDVEPLRQRWDITPIRGARAHAWSLAISRSEVPAPARRRPWNLTARQKEVLTLVARGMTNTSIAETLGIRPGTVEFHISAIFDKVGVNNRAALIACVMER